MSNSPYMRRMHSFIILNKKYSNFFFAKYMNDIFLLFNVLICNICYLKIILYIIRPFIKWLIPPQAWGDMSQAHYTLLLTLILEKLSLKMFIEYI